MPKGKNILIIEDDPAPSPRQSIVWRQWRFGADTPNGLHFLTFKIIYRLEAGQEACY